MKTSKSGKEFLIKEEGVVLKPYLDQVGIPTIGVGSTYWEDGRKVKMTDKPITHERALTLMDTTLKQYEHAVNTAIKVPLSQNMFDALVSLCYNIGTGGFKGSSLVKRINAKSSKESITEAFLMWRNAGGEPILLGRRKREVALFLGDATKITSTGVNLREGPSTTDSVVSVIPKGTEVNVIETKGDWSQVFICATKQSGYVYSKYLI